MLPPPISSARDLAGLVTRLERDRDTFFEQYEESIQGLKKFSDIASLLSLTLIERAVWELVQNLPDSPPDEKEGEEPVIEEEPRYKGTVYERMVQFLIDRNNEPASNAQIRQAIGSSRGTVAMVLYNTYEESFEKVACQGTHIIHWRLTPTVYEEQAEKPRKNGDNPLF